MLACSPAFAAAKTRYDTLMDDGYAQLKHVCAVRALQRS